MSSIDALKYSIFDPTGNITALVESVVDIPRQPDAAAEIMRRHPQVEQVGFVRFPQTEQMGKACSSQAEQMETSRSSQTEQVEKARSSQADRMENACLMQLRMAGGEFCGNASMCAAVLHRMRVQERDPAAPLPERIFLQVSGASRPVQVRLAPDPENPEAFHTSVCMPAPLRIRQQAFSFRELSGLLPVVCMEGIFHIIIEPSSVFYPLKDSREKAEEAVRAWCAQLSADGLGLMFLGEGDTRGDCGGAGRPFIPLVYIPGSATCFWENSCASGSSAAGMYLAAGKGSRISLCLEEPGGCLRVSSDPGTRETWLQGRVRFAGKY